MNLSRLLMVVMLGAACSGEPETTRPHDAPAPAATKGEQPRSRDASPPQPRTRVDTPQSRDEQAAARGPVREGAAQAGVNPHAAVLQDFNARIAKYLEIHKAAEKDGAKLTETADPAEINKKQDVLAARIRALRADAKHGDVFTPEIRNIFRRLLASELKGEDGRDAKAVMKDDAPAPGSVPLKVNAKYPEGSPLPTVPPNVLLNLPRLPEGLEYRIVGKHLVLLDVDANIIIDYIPNAIA